MYPLNTLNRFAESLSEGTPETIAFKNALARITDQCRASAMQTVAGDLFGELDGTAAEPLLETLAAHWQDYTSEDDLRVAGAS